MRAPVRTTTFAVLVTAGLFAAPPPAHAGSVSDDRGPVVDGNERDPLVESTLEDLLAALRNSTACTDCAPPEGADVRRPAPAVEGRQEPDRCGADEDCVLQAPEETAVERPDASVEEGGPARPEPTPAGESSPAEDAEPGPVGDGRQSPSQGSAQSPERWDAASEVPDIAPPLNLGTVDEGAEPRPQALGTATYALTSGGTEDAPLLTAAVATLLLGGVAIYAGYGLGRSDRPNLFR